MNNIQAEVQAKYYVSMGGSDSNPGTESQPFATITKARDVVRTINHDMTGNIVVYIMSGEYYIASTIEFTEADSGTNGYDIIYKNYNEAGSAHFIGGERITGWTRHSGNIYKVNVGVQWVFNTLYENGIRARKARFPKYEYDSSYPMAQAAYLGTEGIEGSNTILQYKSGDFDPSGWDLDDAQIVIWAGGGINWRTHTIPISSMDTEKRLITLSQPARYPLYDSIRKYLGDGGSRYFIQGVYDFLDQAGEFYLDTSEGYLYYWARDGEIADQTIIAPKVQTIISLLGTSETSRVHNIQFDGLVLEDTEFTDFYRFGHNISGESGEGHAYPDYDREVLQSQYQVGAFRMENTNNIAIKNCHINNIGFTGIYMHYYNQCNLVYGNWIEHMGLNGVFLDGKYPGEGNVLKNIVISNNLIHDIGELCADAAAVQIKNSGNNEVSYCEIYNSIRFAVCWDTLCDTPIEEIYTVNNIYKYLKVYNCCHDSGDCGAFYGYGLSRESAFNVNTLDQVTINNINAHPTMTDIPPNGIFMDNQSYGQTYRNVKITNVQGEAFRNNESGNHNFTNVNWSGNFDDSFMDYDNIGLKADFVYGGSADCNHKSLL